VSPVRAKKKTVRRREPASVARNAGAIAAGGAVTPARLMAEAQRARHRAYAPYSRFAVGSALLASSGKIYLGANVENASFGLTTCAERAAVFKAVSEGEREFVAIAVTARDGHGAPPCGSCRQVLQEFSPKMWVYWRDGRGRILRWRLQDLLPNAFHLKARDV
jgi:cytidine deaminase